MLNRVRLVGAKPRLVPLHADTGEWRLDLDALAAAVSPRSRVVFLNNASFPTGWVASDDEWEAVASLCVEHDLWLTLLGRVRGRALRRSDPPPARRAARNARSHRNGGRPQQRTAHDRVACRMGRDAGGAHGFGRSMPDLQRTGRERLRTDRHPRGAARGRRGPRRSERGVAATAGRDAAPARGLPDRQASPARGRPSWTSAGWASTARTRPPASSSTGLPRLRCRAGEEASRSATSGSSSATSRSIESPCWGNAPAPRCKPDRATVSTLPPHPATDDLVRLAAEFQRDGGCVVRGLFDDAEVRRLRGAVERNLAEPSERAIEGGGDAGSGRFFEDFRNWTRIADYGQVIRGSRLGEVAARLMGSAHGPPAPRPPAREGAGHDDPDALAPGSALLQHRRVRHRVVLDPTRPRAS